MSIKKKADIRIINIGFGKYVNVNVDKKLIQFSDSFDRITLTRAEFDSAIDVVKRLLP